MGRKNFIAAGMDRLSTSERTLVAKEVGGYATSDAREFVAEVYAAHYTGKTYSPKVEALYASRSKGLP
jgi:hypothetical protein